MSATPPRISCSFPLALSLSKSGSGVFQQPGKGRVTGHPGFFRASPTCHDTLQSATRLTRRRSSVSVMRLSSPVIGGVLLAGLLTLAFLLLPQGPSNELPLSTRSLPLQSSKAGPPSERPRLRDLPLPPPRQRAAEAEEEDPSPDRANALTAPVGRRERERRAGWRALRSGPHAQSESSGMAPPPAGARLHHDDTRTDSSEQTNQRLGPIVFSGRGAPEEKAIGDLVGPDGEQELMVAFFRLRDSGAFQKLTREELPRIMELMPDSRAVQDADRIFREQLGMGVGEFLAQQIR